MEYTSIYIKELILKNKLESYKDEARNTQNKLNEILKDARFLAQKNHDGTRNPENVRRWLSEIAAHGKEADV